MVLFNSHTGHFLEHCPIYWYVAHGDGSYITLHAAASEADETALPWLLVWMEMLLGKEKNLKEEKLAFSQAVGKAGSGRLVF